MAVLTSDFFSSVNVFAHLLVFFSADMLADYYTLLMADTSKIRDCADANTDYK